MWFSGKLLQAANSRSHMLLQNGELIFGRLNNLIYDTFDETELIAFPLVHNISTMMIKLTVLHVCYIFLRGVLDGESFFLLQ